MKKKYEDIINELTDKELLTHLFITQALLLIISFILGWFLFEHPASFLDLIKWNDSSIWMIGIPAGGIVVLIDLVLMKTLPSSYYDDGGLNERLFSQRSVWQILFIAAIVAVSEEILFRGVIQTHFGLIVSSLIFSLIHYRYLFNWFLFLNITLLSFLVGAVYEWTENLLVTIVMHFVIDALLGLAIKQKREARKRTWNE